MRFKALTWSQYLVWVLLLVWFQVSCTGEKDTGEEGELDCRHVLQDITTFTEKSILPLIDSENPPKIEQHVIEQLKRLREEVATCAPLPDPRSGATEWNEDDFMRLYSRLSLLEVPLELAAEEDDPETTRILINSPSFREAVLELQENLRLVDY